MFGLYRQAIQTPFPFGEVRSARAERSQEGREPGSIQTVYTSEHLQAGYYITVYISCEIQGVVLK